VKELPFKELPFRMALRTDCDRFSFYLCMVFKESS
jgi:hypothetical protein